ncbi:MAG: helix-turn-helix transcriptional regulator [Pseudohongiellaceae bacterium]
MHWTHYASSFMAISQLLFMGLFYLIHYRHRVLGRLMALFCVCLTAYIVSRLPQITRDQAVVWQLLSTLAIAAPALLWVIARYLFIDRRRVHPAFWALIGVYILLRAIGLWLYDGSQSRDTAFFLVFYYLPQGVMLGFACHVVYMACRDRGGDLIELRRRLRLPFAAGMGSVIAMILASGFFLPASTGLDSVFFLVLFILALIMNLAAVDRRPDVARLMSSDPVPDDETHGQSGTSAAGRGASGLDRALMETVRRAMEDDRLYAQPGLTIGDMARQLSIQEYRLRRLINHSMHYRNFNQYLNSYRIREAARLLHDPEQSRLSISAVALEVGYVSLSSFNKAFKDIHGVTPSVYRSGEPGHG